jgi:hypothetical protein
LTVRLAVHGFGGLLARGFAETKDLARTLVEPIPQVVDPILALNLQILPMGLRDAVGGQAIDLVMNVQVERHVSTFLSSNDCLPPTKQLAEVDTQQGLTDDLVNEQSVRRVEAAAPGIAVEPKPFIRF